MSSKTLRAGRPVGKLLLAQMVPKPLSALSQYLPDEWTSMLRGSSDLKWGSLQMGRTTHRSLKPGPEALMGGVQTNLDCAGQQFKARVCLKESEKMLPLFALATASGAL